MGQSAGSLRAHRRLAIFTLVYLVVGLGLTVTSRELDRRYKTEVGLVQSVYLGSVSEGELVARRTGAAINLNIFDENTDLRRRFFSVTWRGVWHFTDDTVVDIFAGADDRIAIHVDNELILDRNITTGLHTVSRTVALSRGFHLINIQYEQYGGDYRVNAQWAPTGRAARPFNIETLFAQDPGGAALSINRRLLAFRQLISVFWILPVVLFLLLVPGPALLRVARRTLPRHARRIVNVWRWFWKAGLNGTSSMEKHTLVSSSRARVFDRMQTRMPSVFIHAVFLFLSMQYCSRFFMLGNLDSHAIRDGDPAAMNWTLQWISHALVTDPINIFNGNVFHPFANSVALTDHMFSLVLMNLPISLVVPGVWSSYNVLIFFAYYLSCVGGYCLIRELTGSRRVAVWAGIYWGFLFFRVHHIGHLQILSFQWIPFVTLYLIRFLRIPSYRSAFICSLLFVVQGLVSWYLAVITSLIVSIVAFSHLRVKSLTGQHARAAALALGVCIVSIGPLIPPYVGSFEDTLLARRVERADFIGDATSLASYLVPPRATYLGQVRERDGKGAPWIWGERTLYIGYAPLSLSAVGLIAFLFRRRAQATNTTESERLPKWTRDHARWITAALVLVFTGFILSKGFVSHEWGMRLPLYYLSEAVLFIKGMRAPQRFALMLYFGVLVLSSFGLWVAVQRARNKLHGTMVVAVVSLVFLFEVYPYYFPMTPAPYQVSQLDRLVARYQVQEDQPLVVLHLPIHHRPNSRYPMAEAVYMLDSTVHWAKVVNGYSGSTPTGFLDNMGILTTLPQPDAIAKLFELDINLIAIHNGTPNQQRRELLSYFGQQRWSQITATQGGEHLVFIDSPP